MKGYIFLLFVLLSSQLIAQEFKAMISVSSAQLEGTDKRVFQELQQSLNEFLNERVWTNYQFNIEEKIECTFMLTLQERLASDEYTGRLNIVYRRPIYKTSYDSPMFNWVDKDIRFKYTQGQPLIYADNTFSSNITSLFAFYLYLILGLDFDSFSPMGGTQFFQKAQAVVNSAQNSPMPGWKAFEKQTNRYWLIENLMNSSYSTIRTFYYKYHRRGLDVMSQNVDIGRSAITLALEDLRKANRQKPGLFLLQIVMDAKRDELRNIYMEAAMMDKTKAVNILSEIDPSHSNTYQNILKERN